MITVIAILGAAVFVLVSALAYFGQARIIFAPDRELATTPDQIGMTFEDVRIATGDSQQIHGWYFPASAPGDSPTVLFCHGNAGNISHRLPTAQMLLDQGVNVLMFDYRGFGLSDGEPSEIGAYADAHAAWLWLTENKGLAPNDIFVFGRSLGGAVAVDLAASVECGGLIVESSFTSIVDMGREVYPYLPVSLLARYHFDSLKKIGRVTCPVLITHSPHDEMIPYQMGQQLYEAATGERTFLAISGGHNDQSYFDNQTYRDGLRQFFGTQVTPASGNGHQIN